MDGIIQSVQNLDTRKFRDLRTSRPASHPVVFTIERHIRQKLSYIPASFLSRTGNGQNVRTPDVGETENEFESRIT